MHRGMMWLAVGGVALCSTVAAETPEEVLTRLDLVAKGRVYCLASEIEFSQRLDDLKKTEQLLHKALKQQAGFEVDVKQAHQRLQGLNAERRRLNDRMMHVRTPLENNRLIAQLNEIQSQIDDLQEALLAVESPHSAEVGRVRLAYLDGLQVLRGLVNATDTGYAALSDNADVRAAIQAVSTEKRVFSLGPRRKYAKDVEKLVKLESGVETHEIPMRHENGVWWVDVKLNGTVVKPFIFDTGASMISLPSAYAAELGMTPGPDDPRLNMQIADGSVVEAAQMVIDSVALGSFDVTGVVCTVQPATLNDAPPLLGGSFLKHFVYQIDPSAGVLKLSRVNR